MMCTTIYEIVLHREVHHGLWNSLVELCIRVCELVLCIGNMHQSLWNSPMPWRCALEFVKQSYTLEMCTTVYETRGLYTRVCEIVLWSSSWIWWHHNTVNRQTNIMLTLSTQGMDYSVQTGSISCLLMSPGHQKPWYWLFIDYVILFSWVQVLTTFTISILRDDIKCEIWYPCCVKTIQCAKG